MNERTVGAATGSSSVASVRGDVLDSKAVRVSYITLPSSGVRAGTLRRVPPSHTTRERGLAPRTARLRGRRGRGTRSSGLLLDGQEKLELRRELLLGVETVREVDAADAAVRVDLRRWCEEAWADMGKQRSSEPACKVAPADRERERRESERESPVSRECLGGGYLVSFYFFFSLHTWTRRVSM